VLSAGFWGREATESKNSSSFLRGAACVNFVAQGTAILSRPRRFFLPQLHIFSGASIPSRSSAVTNCRSTSRLSRRRKSRLAELASERMWCR